jgi:hypothetical protein
MSPLTRRGICTTVSGLAKKKRAKTFENIRKFTKKRGGFYLQEQ